MKKTSRVKNALMGAIQIKAGDELFNIGEMQEDDQRQGSDE
jgi:hypothetical protein